MSALRIGAASGSAPPSVFDAPQRVLGWDVLRGLCALAVASYHLLYWQQLASLDTLGSYGVYLFFVLSGASLAYNYSGKLGTPREAAAFLATRWMRLAPLYIVLCFVYIAILSLHGGRWVERLPLLLALNASFAFGLHDPTLWALLIGGWSLGIEFAYYLAFPFLLVLLPRKTWCALAAFALALLQWWWVGRTAGSAAGYAASAVAYHQLPAFIGYFFGGCIIGHWRRTQTSSLALRWGVLAWAGMAVLLLALNPARQGDELLGLRGATLFTGCFAVVYASGLVRVGHRVAPLARWLGDITYGCYLLHPLYFFGFVWFLLPRVTPTEVAALAVGTRLTIYACVLILSCLTAAASERWFEAPLRRWGKRRLRRPTAAPAYSEASSISS